MDKEDENIRGDQTGGISEVRDGPGELPDVEDDLGAVDVALQVAKLAASGRWELMSIFALQMLRRTRRQTSYGDLGRQQDGVRGEGSQDTQLNHYIIV